MAAKVNEGRLLCLRRSWCLDLVEILRRRRSAAITAMAWVVARLPGEWLLAPLFLDFPFASGRRGRGADSENPATPPLLLLPLLLL